MRELGVAISILGLLFGVAFVGQQPWEEVMDWGWRSISIGMFVGVPTSVVYHLGIYLALSRRGPIPRGWLWRPLGLNAALSSRERLWIVPWAYVGGLGFVIVVLGIDLVGVAMGSFWLGQ